MRNALRSTAVAVAVTLLLFVLLEGASSVALAVRQAVRRPPSTVMAAERQHTEYDTLLGWVHRPKVSLPDLYGPGLALHTNAQRLRARREYPVEVPAGKVRIVCSGDSFTLGHSVADDQAWCALLEREDPRLETVNMGQAAYGVDQAYLWYARDGGRLRHDVQLFAFISSDFERMQYDNFLGYPKPYLRVVGDSLRVENVPVPTEREDRAGRRRLAWAIRSLRTVTILRGLVGEEERERAEEPPGVLGREETERVVAKLLESLKRLNEERRSVLVLVFLPHPLDSSNRTADPWRALVAREAARLGIPYVDLVAEYRKIPALEGEEMFIRPFQPSHFNASGNAWVARLLHERVMALPQVRSKLGGSE